MNYTNINYFSNYMTHFKDQSHTDAAVGPDGVVVLLRHTGITGEAVVSSCWFLYLWTKQCKTARLSLFVSMAEVLNKLKALCSEPHHARSAEYSGVQTASFS